MSGLPFIGVTLDYARDSLSFIRDTQKKYGDVFTCKIARKYFTFITDPFSFSLVVRQSKNLDFQKFAMGFSQRVSYLIIISVTSFLGNLLIHFAHIRVF